MRSSRLRRRREFPFSCVTHHSTHSFVHRVISTLKKQKKTKCTVILHYNSRLHTRNTLAINSHGRSLTSAQNNLQNALVQWQNPLAWYTVHTETKLNFCSKLFLRENSDDFWDFVFGTRTKTQNFWTLTGCFVPVCLIQQHWEVKKNPLYLCPRLVNIYLLISSFRVPKSLPVLHAHGKWVLKMAKAISRPLDFKNRMQRKRREDNDDDCSLFFFDIWSLIGLDRHPLCCCCSALRTFKKFLEGNIKSSLDITKTPSERQEPQGCKLLWTG